MAEVFEVEAAISDRNWPAANQLLLSSNSGGPWKYEIFGDAAGLSRDDWNATLLEYGLVRRGLPAVVKTNGFYAYNKGFGSNEFANFVWGEARRINPKLFNGEKIRLASDLRFDGLGKTQIQKTDYKTSLMTDQLALKRVKKGGATFWDGPTSFIDKDNHIRALEQCQKLSNQLGSSTIAFSKDGYLLLVYQTHKNNQSQGLIAPSGSGSCDWEDIDLSKRYWRDDKANPSKSTDLLAIAQLSATRELIEECGLEVMHKRVQGDLVIKPHAVMTHRILPIGFARAVKRAGKPEFYFVSVLPFTADRIEAARETKTEGRYTAKTERANAPHVNFTASPREIVQQLRKVCKQYSSVDIARSLIVSSADHQIDGMSYPLLQGLALLDAHLAIPKRAEQLATWIKSSAQK